MSPDEIIALRKSLGLSQERFAHILGTTTTSVNRWECEKAKPSRLYVKELKQLRADSGSYICRRKESQEP